MNFYTKHYIRTDRSNRIIEGFSDAFETSVETDICINAQGGRQFELMNIVNPPLTNLSGVHLYKYENGEVRETDREERDTELVSFTKVVIANPTEEYLVDLDYRMSKIELGV